METTIAYLSAGIVAGTKNNLLRTIKEKPLILRADGYEMQLSDIMRNEERLFVRTGHRVSQVGLYSTSTHKNSQLLHAMSRIKELFESKFLPDIEVGDLFFEKHKDESYIVGVSPPFLQLHFPNSDLTLFGKTRSMYGLPLDGEPHLTLLSGPCLYGTQGVTLINEDGNHEEILNPHGEKYSGHICDIAIEKELSFYEFEFIQRIGRTISALSSSTNTHEIKLHVPYEEYLLYLAARGCRGSISSDVIIRYQSAILERGNLLKKNFLDLLKDQSLDKNIEIQFISPLECIRSSIESLVEQRGSSESELVKPLVQELLDKSAIFRLLAPHCEISSLQDISHMSYLCGYFEASQCESSEQRACLVVQNAPEEATFSTLVERIKAHKISPIRIAGLFTQERVFVMNRDGEIFHPYFSNCFVNDVTQTELSTFIV